jgi:hypothetical protein
VIAKEQLTAAELQGLRQAFIDNFLFAQPQFPNGRKVAFPNNSHKLPVF